jgi:DNA-binding CsgD family transcriptional regulator
VTAVVERHRPGSAGFYAAMAGQPLSDREVQVLDLVSRGVPDPEIGRRLSIEAATVQSHVRRILAKLGAVNRTHAVRLGVEAGCLPVGPVPPPVSVGPVPPKLGKPVRGLLAVPPGTILADKFGDAVQRVASGAFWVLGEQWPQLASEVVGRGPFEVLRRPGGGAS